MTVKRLGLAVWVKNTKTARNLRRFGSIHYISRRLKYVSMYVDADNFDETMRRIQKLHFVKKVEPSYRHLIPTNYDNSRPDEAKEFDIQMDAALLLAKRKTVLEGEEANQASI